MLRVDEALRCLHCTGRLVWAIVQCWAVDLEFDRNRGLHVLLITHINCRVLIICVMLCPADRVLNHSRTDGGALLTVMRSQHT